MKKDPFNQGRSSRRSFLEKSCAGAGALAVPSWMSRLGGQEASAPQLLAQAGHEPKAEKLVRELLGSLSEEQRGKLVIPWDNPLRQRVENNWHILRERVGTHFKTEQQLLIRDIFLELHSDQMRDEVWRQFQEDNRDPKAKTPDEVFGTASVALFEDTASGKFEFVLTGRHTTRRCDGNSTEKVAFGGPIFYGHASKSFNEAADHPGNAYWFQAKRANALFEMLDGKQREKALKGDSRGEKGTATVALSGKAQGIEGLPAWEMSEDQRNHLLEVVSDLLLPFRSEDRIEAATMTNNQLANVHLAFYKNEDIGNDGVWDTWQLEGPQMIWYFRGKPHVHTWVHVKEPDAASNTAQKPKEGA